MTAPWSGTNTSAASVAATFSVSQPTNAVAQGQQTRLRALEASLGGSAAGSDTLQVKDGGTVLMAMQMSVPANGFASVSLTGLDIRASGTMTVAFASGVASDVETVNAQGDFVQTGLPYGANPGQ